MNQGGNKPETPLPAPTDPEKPLLDGAGALLDLRCHGCPLELVLFSSLAPKKWGEDRPGGQELRVGGTAIICPCPAPQDWCLWAAPCWCCVATHRCWGAQDPSEVPETHRIGTMCLEVPPDLAQHKKPPSSHPKSPVPKGHGAEQQLRGCWMLQLRGRQSLPPRWRNPPCASLSRDSAPRRELLSTQTPTQGATSQQPTSCWGFSRLKRGSSWRDALSLRSRSVPVALVALSQRVPAPSRQYLPGVAARCVTPAQLAHG